VSESETQSRAYAVAMDKGRNPHESAGFWITVAGAVLLMGGVLVSVGVALKSPKQIVWAQPWFDVGIVVLIAGVLILAWSVRLYLVGDLSTPKPKPPAPSVPPPDVSSASGAEPKEDDAPATRQVVDVTPEYLVGFFDAHTSMQASKLVEPYLGKWMKVSGPMGTVGGFTTFSQVAFAFGTFGSLPVYLWFRDRDVVENSLSALEKGDQITVLGQIDQVDAVRLQLDNCELIDVVPAGPQLVFDEAPPELADMSPASIKELLAGRTAAQGKTLMKQHVGKPVRVSGEVEDVSLANSYRGSVSIRQSGFLLLLFFDLDDEDPGGQLLVAINPGDRLVVSGVIREIQANLVALDNCKVIDVKGWPS
jgi:hypothetical protein